MEFLVPLRSTQAVNGNTAQALLNPDLGVLAYASVPVLVNADVIFRDGFDGLQLFLDICTVPGTSGCHMRRASSPGRQRRSLQNGAAVYDLPGARNRRRRPAKDLPC